MPIYLRQSTASQEVTLGQFLDSTDGNTEETGLTIANTDILIHKAGATTLATKNSGGATHISNGIYYAVLDATDSDTAGPMAIYCHPTGALATKTTVCVLPAVVYDSLIAGTDTLTVDVTQFGGSNLTSSGGIPEVTTRAMTAAALKDFFDTDTTTTYASAVAGSVVKETADNAGGSSLTVADIADGVWDEALSGHTTAGTAGKALSDAGSAGDPWSTSVPGAYSAGSAGYILGTNLDATISSRLAPTTSGRTLDVTSTGAAGIDWGNVENPTTTLGLTGTTVGTVTTVTNVPGAVRSNTAQAGAASTITLDSSASSTNDLYNDHIIQITGGTGAGQARRITDYVGSTKVATVEPAWQTNPDNTSTFSINANAKASLLPTAIQAIWDALTSALTTASSIGKLIVDKLALITSTTTIQTESLVSTDQLITIYQGRTKAITLTVSHTAIDLTGFTPKFGLTKITSNSGTSTLEVTGTVNNPGATGQSVSFSLTAVQTAALAQSPTPDHPFRLSVATAYAYRYSIAATNGSTSCPQLSQNYVDVKPGDTTC